MALDVGDVHVYLTISEARTSLDLPTKTQRKPRPFYAAHPTLIVAAHRGAAEHFAAVHDLVFGEWIGACPGVLPTSLDSGLASFETGEVIITDRVEVDEDLWA